MSILWSNPTRAGQERPDLQAAYSVLDALGVARKMGAKPHPSTLFPCEVCGRAAPREGNWLVPDGVRCNGCKQAQP